MHPLKPLAPGSTIATPVAIALGSNLGDRLRNLRLGLGAVSRHISDLRTSAVYESDPVGVVDQPHFLNACCAGTTRLTPRQLLSHLQDAEQAAGRRFYEPRFGPRELDLDILLWGDRIIRLPGLDVPHPRMRERAFVLVPLAEIVPHWAVPDRDGSAQKPTVADLAERLDKHGLRQTEHSLKC